MKNLLLQVLGITKHNQEIREIKDDLQSRVDETIKTNNRANREVKKMLLQKGTTLNIARAVGAVRDNQKYVTIR